MKTAYICTLKYLLRRHFINDKFLMNTDIGYNTDGHSLLIKYLRKKTNWQFNCYGLGTGPMHGVLIAEYFSVCNFFCQLFEVMIINILPQKFISQTSASLLIFRKTICLRNEILKKAKILTSNGNNDDKLLFFYLINNKCDVFKEFRLDG